MKEPINHSHPIPSSVSICLFWNFFLAPVSFFSSRTRMRVLARSFSLFFFPISLVCSQSLNLSCTRALFIFSCIVLECVGVCCIVLQCVAVCTLCLLLHFCTSLLAHSLSHTYPFPLSHPSSLSCTRALYLSFLLTK